LHVLVHVAQPPPDPPRHVLSRVIHARRPAARLVAKRVPHAKHLDAAARVLLDHLARRPLHLPRNVREVPHDPLLVLVAIEDENNAGGGCDDGGCAQSLLDQRHLPEVRAGREQPLQALPQLIVLLVQQVVLHLVLEPLRYHPHEPPLQNEHLLPDLPSDHDLLALHERLGPQEAAQARHEARRPALEEGDVSQHVLEVVHHHLAAQRPGDHGEDFHIIAASLPPRRLHVLAHSTAEAERDFAAAHVVVEALDLAHVLHALGVHLHEQRDGDGDEGGVEDRAQQRADHRDHVLGQRRVRLLPVAAHEGDGGAEAAEVVAGVAEGPGETVVFAAEHVAVVPEVDLAARGVSKDPDPALGAGGPVEVEEAGADPRADLPRKVRDPDVEVELEALDQPREPAHLEAAQDLRDARGPQ